MASVEPITYPSGAKAYRVRWREPGGATARTRTFKRRRDADAWRTKVEHDLLAGSYVDHALGKETFAEYSERWRAAQVWAPSTAHRVAGLLARDVYPTLGAMPIGSIRPSHVQSWVAGLHRRQAAATVQHAATYVSSVFKAAVLDRVIATNPATGVKLPKRGRREVTPPTTEQVLGIADALGSAWSPIIVTMAGTGLRISEALALDLSAVDFLRRQVQVARQVTEEPGKPRAITSRLKSEASYRTVPLPDSVGRALAAHLERTPASPAGLIFHHGGKVRGRKSVNAALDRAIARAAREGSAVDYAGMTPHSFRHFYASLLIESGASVKTVQKRLGHASAMETLDVYAHLWPDSEEQTRDAVDLVLAGPGLARGLTLAQ